MILEDEALNLLPVDLLRMELRIPDNSHDKLLTAQIVASMNFISEATGRGAADLDNPALRSAAIILCRQFYNGYREIRPTEAFWAILDPYRNLAGVFPSSPLVIVNPVTSGHVRYFGWSDDKVIATADFAAASTSETNKGTLPVRSTDGYIWFAVPEAAGYPGSLHLNEGPLDQLAVFVRQLGLVDDLNGDPQIVGISFDIQGAALSGQAIAIGY